MTSLKRSKANWAITRKSTAPTPEVQTRLQLEASDRYLPTPLYRSVASLCAVRRA